MSGGYVVEPCTKDHGLVAHTDGRHYHVRPLLPNGRPTTDDNGNPICYPTRKEADKARRERDRLVTLLAEDRGDRFRRQAIRRGFKRRRVPPTGFGTLK